MDEVLQVGRAQGRVEYFIREAGELAGSLAPLSVDSGEKTKTFATGKQSPPLPDLLQNCKNSLL